MSSISALEIGLKHRKGALELPLPPDQWFPQALAFHGLVEIGVDSETALRSAALPPLHLDPCDRILVATALIRSLSVLSPDPLLCAYPGVRCEW